MEQAGGDSLLTLIDPRGREQWFETLAWNSGRNMSHYSRMRVLVAVLFVFILGTAAACTTQSGGSADDGPSLPAAPVDSGTGLPVVAADPAEAGAAETSPAPVQAGNQETDYLGIPVGFTETGIPYRGSIDAPVILEEFSDFQCPFCARFSEETLPTLLEEKIATGEVVLLYYDFPLTNIHPQAMAAHNAARCAGEQSAAAYWGMHDLLFADLRAWSNGNPNEAFARLGDELGLQPDSFVACLEEMRYQEQIEADINYGRSRGVGSTPSFFLNDQPLVGAQPLNVFESAIARVQQGDSIAAAPEPQVPAVKPTPATILADDVAASLGDPDAPITIVEYTDYQCPFCQRYTLETKPTVIQEMVESGRVYYQLKDFPLDNIHPEARAASVAARCAGEQDQYWAMHDILFAQQSTWSGTGAGAADLFTAYAADLGLDVSAFEICQASGQFDEVIQANLDEGLALGVRGTPSFFIAGFPVSGAQPFELFDYAVGLAEEGTLADAYVPSEAQQQQQTPPTPSGPVEVAIEDSYSIGDPDAPVVIVEFTDFQCPFCSRHNQQTFPQIKANYIDTGLVRYVFKDFPLTSIHPQAVLAAQAARCAGEQEADAYLTMHGLLFANQQAWSGQSNAAELFAGYAADAGLDGEALAACLESGQFEAAVGADLDEGIRLGVTGTPAFFLNGQLLSGAQPYEVFAQAIDQLTAE